MDDKPEAPIVFPWYRDNEYIMTWGKAIALVIGAISIAMAIFFQMDLGGVMSIIVGISAIIISIVVASASDRRNELFQEKMGHFSAHTRDMLNEIRILNNEIKRVFGKQLMGISDSNNKLMEGLGLIRTQISEQNKTIEDEITMVTESMEPESQKIVADGISTLKSNLEDAHRIETQIERLKNPLASSSFMNLEIIDQIKKSQNAAQEAAKLYAPFRDSISAFTHVK